MFNLLFPAETQLQIEACTIEADRVEIVAHRATGWAQCPNCTTKSQRRHSTYERRPSDLPCIGHQVRLRLSVKRFFCDNDNCPKKTFAEPFPGLLKRWAHRTGRLVAQQTAVGFELGGEAGRRVAWVIQMPVSADTLLDDIRRAPEPEVKTPRVLGIDDWAKRKGMSYGTILIDLESGEPIDVLDSRNAQTVEAWLESHPAIEIVSRDRSKEYKKAVSNALPEATQVADRWHLLKNLRDAVEKYICDKPAYLQAAAVGAAALQEKTTATGNNQVVALSAEKETPTGEIETSDPKIDAVATQRPVTKAEQERATRRARRQERFDYVNHLYQAGRSIRSIAGEMKMSTRTVNKYVLADECPHYPTGVTRGSKLTPFVPYLESRWQSGMTNASQLWRELRDEHHFTGGRGLVALWAAEQRKLLPRPLQYARQQPAGAQPQLVRLTKPAPWSARTVSWLLFHDKSRLDFEETAALEAVLATDTGVTAVYELIQQFREMVKKRLPDSLPDWLEAITDAGYRGLIGFANGVRQDLDEVLNALALRWNNGACEGHINRLKFLKRQMYGRANFDLLRKRVLYRPAL